MIDISWLITWTKNTSQQRGFYQVKVRWLKSIWLLMHLDSISHPSLFFFNFFLFNKSFIFLPKTREAGLSSWTSNSLIQFVRRVPLEDNLFIHVTWPWLSSLSLSLSPVHAGLSLSLFSLLYMQDICPYLFPLNTISLLTTWGTVQC